MRKAATETTNPASEASAGAGHAKPAAQSTPTTPIEALRFDLLQSAVYHDLRQTTLQRVHRTMLFVTILLGSSAIAAFGNHWPLIGQVSGIAIASIGAAQLVWDFAGAARDHADLKRRLYGLLSKLDEGSKLDDINAALALVYADEPPSIDRVSRRAHNRAGESLFGDDFTRV